MTFFRCLPAMPHSIPTGIGASLFGALAVSFAATIPVFAQSRLPACPPPVTQEYLLLVRGETEADRNKIASVLPAGNTVLVCEYLNETLVRAGGFDSLETVNAWATYMKTVAGFESFVSRPSQTASLPPATRSNSSTDRAAAPIARALAYQPQRLAPGYAVLVDYGKRPELATTVGQFVNPVGLAVYQQRTYLLADYTSDAATAADTLQQLSDAQMAAILVDAQQVVQLVPEVARF